MKHASLLASLLVTACFSPGDAEPIGGSTTGSTSEAGATGSPETVGGTETPGAGGSDSTGGASTDTSGADPSDGEGSSESTGEPDDPTTSGAGEEPCPDGFVCGLDVPPGWDGPYMRLDGEPIGACGGSYTELARTLFAGLLAPPASCSCSCSGVQGADCSPANIRRYSANDCGGDVLEEFELEVGECQAYDDSGSTNYSTQLGFSPLVPTSPVEFTPSYQTNPSQSAPPSFVRPFRFAPSILLPGSCDPAESEAVEPVAWESTTQLCGSLALDCEEEGCWPQTLGDAPLCIAHEGEHECPADFENRSLLHAGADDNRSCSSCTCGAPTGLSCDGLELEDHVISANSGPVTMDGNCSLETLAGEFCFEPDLSGSCAPSGGVAQGTATPTGTMTICCAS